MESPRAISGESISPIRKRVEDAFAILTQEKPAASPDQAREMFREAFEKAEEHIPKKDRRLNLATASDMTEMLYGDVRVRVSVYKSHVLFLGERGAIEVCLFPKDHDPVDDELVQTHHNLTVVFEKPGADGRRLWEK